MMKMHSSAALSCRRPWARGPFAARPPAHRRQHLQAVGEVPQEGHDSHALRQPLHLAEVQHEAILGRQLVQRAPLALKLPQRLHLRLRGHEAHQALHKIHRQSGQVEAVGSAELQLGPKVQHRHSGQQPGQSIANSPKVQH